MAGSVNKVILVGNVGADPEIRRTQDGRPIANLRIATSETWRDRNSGERREKTEWHTVVVFNEGLCKVVEQYVKKGAKLYIEGQLQTKKWTDSNNVERYTTEIIVKGLQMLDNRNDRPAEPHHNQGQGTAHAQGAPATTEAPPPADFEDDIPF